MFRNQFAGVVHSSLVRLLVLAAMQEQVVAHTTANETLLNAWQGVDGTIDLKEFGMVGIQIRAYLRMNATGAFTFLAGILVAPRHAIHVG